jgi:hypothetical protein
MLRKALFAALLALPLAASAQTYRCVGKDGKKYYGQSVPPACLGMPVEQLNAQGMVVKRFDAAATAAEREKKAHEDEERKKREALSKEEGRRNRALLATYTSEADIDAARARALKENEAAVKEIEIRIANLKKDRDKVANDTQSHDAKNPGQAQKADKAKLEQRLKGLEFDIQTQEQLLAAKQKEVASINARYDEDRKRYIELTRGKK